MRRRTGPPRAGLWAALAVAVLGVLAACTPPAAAVHPMGASCTWPADLDPQRDGLAVLYAEGRGDPTPTELVLLDVATGGLRARCMGAEYAWGGPSFGHGKQSPTQSRGSVLFPPVSPDWRLALSTAGVVEPATGRVVGPPVPGWDAVALPGEGHVLRRRAGLTSAEEDYDPGNWCLAPRPDAPPQECEPLSGGAPGFPVVGRDGTVGWASQAEVPVQLGPVAAVVQTDGRRILQLQVPPSYNDTTSVVDASGRAGLIDYSAFRNAPGNAAFAEQPGWYTLDRVDASGVDGRLHVGASSWAEVRALAAELGAYPDGAIVVDGGRAVVVALRGFPLVTAYFVRIAEDAPARVLVSLPVGGTSDGRLVGEPVILAWPDSASPVEP
jgi:hypothetical protein